MKLIQLILIILLSQNSSFADKPKTYIVPLKEGLYTLKVEAYVSPISIKAKNNRTYFWLKSKAVHSSVGGYSGLLLHGSYESFYTSNQLRVQGQFKSGLKIGEWQTRHENGLIKEIHTYKHGRLHGLIKKYDNNGQILLKGRYKHGKRHGTHIIYSNGLKTSVDRYKNGQIQDPKIPKEKNNSKKKQLKERKIRLKKDNDTSKNKDSKKNESDL